jgi:hypothetical protein
MASSIRAYTLGEGLSGLAPMAIQSHRAPTTRDSGQIGQIWVNMNNNNFYVLTSRTPTQYIWSSLSNGAGLFNSITTVTTVTAGTAIIAGTTITAAGNITSTVGDITASAGDINVTLGDIIVAAGDIEVTQGNVIAGDVLSGGTVYSAGDLGGVAATTAITNVDNHALGAGALTLLSTTANPGTNTGYLKMYLGAATIWVPYFTNIAP